MQKSFSFGWFEAMRDEVFVNNWNYSTFDGSLWWNGIGFFKGNLIYLRDEFSRLIKSDEFGSKGEGSTRNFGRIDSVVSKKHYARELRALT